MCRHESSSEPGVVEDGGGPHWDWLVSGGPVVQHRRVVGHGRGAPSTGRALVAGDVGDGGRGGRRRERPNVPVHRCSQQRPSRRLRVHPCRGRQLVALVGEGKGGEAEGRGGGGGTGGEAVGDVSSGGVSETVTSSVVGASSLYLHEASGAG